MSSNPFSQAATTQNTHLPDDLAEVRAAIKQLKKDEEAIIAEIKSVGNCFGKSFSAEVQTTIRKSLDTKKLKETYGDHLDEFYRETEVTSVKIKEIEA